MSVHSEVDFSSATPLLPWFWVILMLEDPSVSHLQCSGWEKEDLVQDFEPLIEKQLRSIMFPPPCLSVGVVWFWFHLTTAVLPESLANLRSSCTCSFLSRGTLWTLHCVLPPSLGLIRHLSHDHSNPMRQEHAWSSRLRAIGGHFYLFHFQIITPIFVIFSPSFLLVVL